MELSTRAVAQLRSYLNQADALLDAAEPGTAQFQALIDERIAVLNRLAGYLGAVLDNPPDVEPALAADRLHSELADVLGEVRDAFVHPDQAERNAARIKLATRLGEPLPNIGVERERDRLAAIVRQLAQAGQRVIDMHRSGVLTNEDTTALQDVIDLADRERP